MLICQNGDILVVSTKYVSYSIRIPLDGVTCSHKGMMLESNTDLTMTWQKQYYVNQM